MSRRLSGMERPVAIAVEPLPWWMDYFQAAERIGGGCKPWELLDDDTPRWFWLEAAMTLGAAEAAAHRTRQERDSALAAAEAAKARTG